MSSIGFITRFAPSTIADRPLLFGCFQHYYAQRKSTNPPTAPALIAQLFRHRSTDHCRGTLACTACPSARAFSQPHRQPLSRGRLSPHARCAFALTAFGARSHEGRDPSLEHARAEVTARNLRGVTGNRGNGSFQPHPRCAHSAAPSCRVPRPHLPRRRRRCHACTRLMRSWRCRSTLRFERRAWRANDRPSPVPRVCKTRAHLPATRRARREGAAGNKQRTTRGGSTCPPPRDAIFA